MEKQQYEPDMERFFEEHPDIDPDWKSLISPAVQGSQEAVFRFVMSYIFM